MKTTLFLLGLLIASIANSQDTLTLKVPQNFVTPASKNADSLGGLPYYFYSTSTDLATKLDNTKKSIVTTVAGLKSITNPQFDVFYSTTDYGGGVWQFIATSTKREDTGTVIKLTSVATGRLERIFSGAINVKWFGAKGDGVTDDLAALTAAEAAAYLSQTREVYLPFGNYRISDTWYLLHNNVTVKGTGSEKNIELGGYQASSTTITPDKNDRPAISTISANLLTFSRGVTIEDVSIRGIGTISTNSCAIKVGKGSGQLVQNVIITGFYYGVWASAVIYAELSKVTASGCGVGINVDGIGGYSQSNIININQCVAKGDNIAFLIASCTSASLFKCSAEYISSQVGIYTGGLTQGVVVHDNNNTNFNVKDLYVEGADHVTISNNTNPSKNSKWDGVFYNNHTNYVYNGLLGDFGTLNDGTALDNVYIKNVDTTLSNGTYSTTRGRITIRGNNNIRSVTGGYIRSTVDSVSSSIILNCTFGISKFGGIFVEAPAKSTSYPAIVGKFDKFGYGSPLTKVSAPIGAIYRQLDGMAGAIIWQKNTGTDSLGWISINDFNALVNKPRTVNGYGITDAATTSFTVSSNAESPITDSVTVTSSGVQPTGINQHTYYWTKVGNIVFYHFKFQWPVAGTLCTLVSVNLPSDMPLPIDPVGLTNTGDIGNNGSGRLYSLTNATGTTGAVNIYKNSSSSSYRVQIVSSSTNLMSGIAQGFYQTN